MPEPVDLDAIYRRHGPSVFRRARQILGREADAYEIVQDVFLSLAERPDQYQGRSSITSFLYSVTTHACLNRIRNQRNRDRLQHAHFATDEDKASSSPSPEQTLMLHRAIQSLPDQLCQAAIYHWIDGMTHEEIAHLMQCSRRHVGDLLKQATAWANTEEHQSC